MDCASSGMMKLVWLDKANGTDYKDLVSLLDMLEMERKVRSVTADGLIWGACMPYSLMCAASLNVCFDM
jgi:hypothetical protein